jgi:hypothetical protein
MPGVALSFPPEGAMAASDYYLLWRNIGNRMANL